MAAMTPSNLGFAPAHNKTGKDIFLEKMERVATLTAINTGLAQQGLMLETGTTVDATIIAASSSTKNQDGERDRGVH